jgi:chromosome segregation ATPase
LLPIASQMISEVDFKAALADFDARVAKRDARIKELKARTAEDAEAAQAAAEQLAATNAAAVALKARIAKLKGRIARRDARIAKKAAAVKKAVQQLAAKDAELAAKDEQIAALIARFAQFEEAATATGDSHQTVKQEPQEAERPRKKRPRQGFTHQHLYNIISYCDVQMRYASHKSSCKHCVPSHSHNYNVCYDARMRSLRGCSRAQ